MDTLDFGLEVKSVTEEGQIEGYGAVFNNVDQYYDRIVPGAFSASLAQHQKQGTMPMMLWNHDPYQPIGVWQEVAEDKKGLKVKGQIISEVAKGAEVLALIRKAAIRGLSIGYRTTSDVIENGVRLLKAVDLWEISPVSFPANGKALITGVKSGHPIEEFARRLRDGEPPEIKEFEDILRDAGVPKTLATRIASVGYARAIRSDSEGKASDAALAVLRDAVRSFATT